MCETQSDKDKTVGGSPNPFCDQKWTNGLQTKFWSGELEGEILGIKIDQVSGLVVAVRGCVGWSGRAKSGWILGSGFQACQNLDFGVRVGLGECIEMMPLSSPSVPDFGVQVLRKLLSRVRVGLSVQMTRESGCESRGQISVSAEGVRSIWTGEYTTEST